MAHNLLLEALLYCRAVILAHGPSDPRQPSRTAMHEVSNTHRAACPPAMRALSRSTQDHDAILYSPPISHVLFNPPQASSTVLILPCPFPTPLSLVAQTSRRPASPPPLQSEQLADASISPNAQMYLRWLNKLVWQPQAKDVSPPLAVSFSLAACRASWARRTVWSIACIATVLEWTASSLRHMWRCRGFARVGGLERSLNDIPVGKRIEPGLQKWGRRSRLAVARAHTRSVSALTASKSIGLLASSLVRYDRMDIRWFATRPSISPMSVSRGTLWACCAAASYRRVSIISGL